MPEARVGFAGMTHLGIVSSAAVASCGFETVCYHADDSLVARLRAGEPPVIEPGLPELMARGALVQRFTSDPEDLRGCDVVYIAADVPTDDAGSGDLAAIAALLGDVIAHLGDEALLVVLCQVPPGFTRCVPLSNDRLFYQVETLIFGRAVERATQPERYIVGQADPALDLPAPYLEVLEAFDCPIIRMRYESAELAKIAVNMCLVAQLAVANTMAEVAEAIGADWREIIPALESDRRIGPHAYLAPGLGIAGGNLERDLATILRIAEEHGTDGGVVRAWLDNSRHRRGWALRVLHRELLGVESDPLIAVWGLAYKENTASTKNSPSLYTLGRLTRYRLCVHDPAVPAAAARHPRVEGVDDPLDAARGADALLILTPWPQYRQQEPARLAALMRGRLVLDPYGLLEADAARRAGLRCFTLGAPSPC